MERPKFTYNGRFVRRGKPARFDPEKTFVHRPSSRLNYKTRVASSPTTGNKICCENSLNAVILSKCSDVPPSTDEFVLQENIVTHLNKFQIVPVTLIGCVTFAYGPASAETKFDAKASFSGKDESVHHELMEGHLAVMGVNTVEEMTTEDPNNPQNGATGTCFGLLNFMADKADGSGYCSMKDTDGDKWASSWTLTGTNEDGSINYDWAILGGTGKWQRATGGGTIRQVFNEDHTEYTNEMMGEFVLK